MVTGARWRTAIGEEVGFVIEAGGRLVPIEVKAMGPPAPRQCDAPAHLPGGIR
jgi:hypothetical protein